MTWKLGPRLTLNEPFCYLLYLLPSLIDLLKGNKAYQ